MIIVTTAGTYLIEATHSEDYMTIHSSSVEELEAVIEQLELVGTVDNPPVLVYDVEGIEESRDHSLPYVLKVHRADVALFLQSEVLNFTRYRRFVSHAVGLRKLGQDIAKVVFG